MALAHVRLTLVQHTYDLSLDTLPHKATMSLAEGSLPIGEQAESQAT